MRSALMKCRIRGVAGKPLPSAPHPTLRPPGQGRLQTAFYPEIRCITPSDIQYRVL
ncbi:TPA: hypothetical protein ACFIRN_001202 [Neisseria gonorrhoeae]